jgi:hypothetical protein
MGGAAKKKSGKKHVGAGGLNTISAASNRHTYRSKGMSDLTLSHVEIAPGKEGAVRKHVWYRVRFH